MKCEVCQKAPATVHLTDVSNNSKREIHLCENCAREQGVTIKSYLHKTPSYPEFVTQLAHSQSEAPSEEREATCPRCGMTYRKFRATGKLGCPNDYAVFKKGLVGLLEKIHGKVQHAGKVPLRASDQIARQRELRSLRAELEKAVREEAYERAAQLRDRIHELEGRKEDASRPGA
ncbi:MAG: UvrB/UvrC motif-containing protein [Planctomycetota bacterium]